MKISYKPIIGEYAYFDPRISLEKHDFLINSNKICNFSSKENRKFTKWITNHGIIKTIK
jgi:hypothetical protein|tara:strand:+ start:5438 stop:5614 length:177 start_codon:yes stop_codon:yes gene_type:complete